MTSFELLDWLNANPFEPFRLKLTNGDAIHVTKPQDMLTGHRSAIIGVPSPGNAQVYDHWKTVSMLHMVAIEPINPVPQAD